MKTTETRKCDFGRANATEPTAIAKATPASSIFPRWPQNTMLTKPIRKLINWEINWKRDPNGNYLFFGCITIKKSEWIKLIKLQVHHIQCLTDLLLGKTLFQKALKQEKSSYLLWQLTCITLSGGSFLFLNASATSLALSLKKKNPVIAGVDFWQLSASKGLHRRRLNAFVNQISGTV